MARQSSKRATTTADTVPDENSPWTRLDRADREVAAQAWLELLCRRSGIASAGLLLMLQEGPLAASSFEPIARWTAEGEPDDLDHRLLVAARQALIDQRPLDVEAETGTIAAIPLRTEEKLLGSVALRLGRPTPATQIAELVRWGAGWLVAHQRAGSVQSEANRGERIAAVLDLAAPVVEAARFGPAGTGLASGLATHFACSRVSIGLHDGRRTKIAAESHGTKSKRSSTLSQAVELAMDECQDQSRPLLDPPNPAARPVVPSASLAHAQLRTLCGATGICSVPFGAGDSTLGAITLERSESTFLESEVQLIEAVAAFAGPPLAALARAERPFLRQAKTALLSRAQNLFETRGLSVRLGAAGLIALLLALAIAPTTHRVTADAVIEADELHAIAVPFDGYLANVHARPGDRVQAGQLLVELDDRDAALQAAALASRISQLQKRARQAVAKRDAAESEIANASLQEARAELARAKGRLERTQLRSPIEGMVALGDPTQELGAPVARGDVLYEITPDNAYRLAIEVDEREIAAVSETQKGHLVLEAMPDQSVPFEVTEVMPVSNARDGLNFFRVEAKLDSDGVPLRSGLEGVAKIDVGERSRFWIWTHSAFDTVRLFLWRWWP